MKSEFINHSEVAHLHETTAQLVGVNRGEDMYKKVSFKTCNSYNISQSHHLKCMLFMAPPFQMKLLRKKLTQSEHSLITSRPSKLKELRLPISLFSKLRKLSTVSRISSQKPSSLESPSQGTAVLTEE